MNTTLKTTSPYILVLLGLLLLFLVGQAVLAGVCFLFGIIMILERIWPEKWGEEKK